MYLFDVSNLLFVLTKAFKISTTSSIELYLNF